MFIRKGDGSVTSIPDHFDVPDGATQIDEAEAREAHPALFGAQPDDGRIADYPTVGQVGQIDPRVIESTPSIGEAGFSRRNERPEDVARRAAEQAAATEPTA